MSRGRKPNIEPTEDLHVYVKRPLAVRVRLLLYSEAEQRVPHGALAKFFEELIVRHLDFQSLDLAPYTAAPAGLHVIKAAPETIDLLRKILERSVNQ